MELYSTERVIYTNWLARAEAERNGVTVFNYNDEGNVTSDAYSLPHGTWLTAEYVIPASDAGATEPYTYSFKITDKSTGEVIYEEPAIVSKGKGLPTQYIRFGSQTSSTYYLDNISIVPEPGVLSLLGIGGAMVMRRRK